MKKVFSIVVMVVILLTIASSAVLAIDPKNITGTGTTLSTDAAINVGNNIYGAIRIVGTIVAVVMLAVIGIKYMVGSAEAKAEYKKTFIPYIVGAILIFGASQIAGVAQSWSNGIANGVITPTNTQPTDGKN